jgi:SAM-dependent methyltransferase
MWDERYSGREYFYGKEPNDFLREQISIVNPGERVLCLAEGEGRNAVFIAGVSANLHVVALDASATGLAKTKELAAERNVSVSTVHADLAEFDLGLEEWDVVVSIWCHLPSALRKQVHAAVVRALKPGGRLILEAYTPDQLKHGTGGPKSVDMLMQLNDLKSELAGLEVVIGRECERDIHEGQGHQGLSAVVQVVAKKR